MHLINEQSTPKYSRLANKTINPGGRSRDLDVFSKAYRDIVAGTKGFKVRLSEEDLQVLRDIVDRWVVGELVEVGSLGIDSEPYDPKSGFNRLIDRIIDKRKAYQAALSARLKENREREAKIQAESNFLDESGNPVNDKVMAQAVRDDVKPELHPEMGSDLKSVLANNLAIMTTASGKPIESKPGIVAGSTQVPTDPKWYQAHKDDLPPGMPDFGKGIVEGEKMKAAMKNAPGVPQF